MNDTNELLINIQRVNIKLPSKDMTYAQVKADVLLDICQQFLKIMKVEVKLDKMQRIPQFTKLSEYLNKFFSKKVSLQSLLNPSENDVKMILIQITNIISEQFEDQVDDTTLNIQEQIRIAKVKQQKNILNNFVKRKYIHPSLLSNKQTLYKNIQTNITLQDLKSKPILTQFSGSHKQHLIQSVKAILLTDQHQKIFQKKIKEQFYTEDYQKIILDISNKLNKKIQDNNIQAWNNKINIKNMQREMNAIQFEQQIKEQEDNTLYNLQKQYQMDEEDDIQTDIVTLKNKHKEQLEKINSELEKNEKKFIKFQNKKQDMEEKIQQDEELTIQLNQKNIEFNEKLISLKYLLELQKSDSAEKEINQQIIKINEEIQQQEKKWEEHRNEEVQHINDVKDVIRETNSKYDQLKSDVKKIAIDFKQLQGDYSEAKDQQLKLQDELQKLPEELDRNNYLKKAQSIMKSYQECKEDLQKIVGELNTVEKQIFTQNNQIQRYKTDIETDYNNNTKKMEQLNYDINKMYLDYNKVTDQTVEQLNKIIEMQILQKKN